MGYIDFAPMSPEKSRGVIRNAPQTSKLLVQVLRKIPIFKGLSPSQVKKILGLCVHKSYKLGTTAICGPPSIKISSTYCR